MERAPPGVLDDVRALGDVEVPLTNATPGRVPGITTLRQAFQPVKDAPAGVDVYVSAFPFAPHLVTREARGRDAGTYAPRGLSVTGPQGRLPFSAKARPGTWGWSLDGLEIRVAEGAPVPEARRHKISFDGLAAAERSLAFQDWNGTAADFVARTYEAGHEAWKGLYLPAPGSVTWQVDVPMGGIFVAGVVVVPSLLQGTGSDGAAAILEVVPREGEGGPREVGRVDAERTQADFRVSLDRYEGQQITLRLRTDPGLTRFYDHVMVVRPRVIAPEASPTHVVVVDLGGVGAADVARARTPSIDAFMATAASFPDAIAPAPWEGPSLKALLSGGQPEAFEVGRTLVQPADAAGFATLTVLAGQGDDVAADLLVGVPRWQLVDTASVASEAAQRFLAAHRDQDALVVVHLGPLQAPYLGAARTLPRDVPEDIDALRAIDPAGRTAARLRPILKARLDAEVSDRDAALGRLLANLRSDAIVVVTSDHGQSLWNDGSIGAGEGVSDAVLKVPLAVRATGVVPGQHPGVVTLADVGPTVFDLAALGTLAGATGTSIRGPAEGAEMPGDRAVVSGRVRAGVPAWRVQRGEQVWTSVRGTRTLEPPPEGVQDDAPWLADVADAVGAPLVRSWHVELGLSDVTEPVTVRVEHPDGIAAAWTQDGHTVPVAEGVATYAGDLQRGLARALDLKPPSGAQPAGLGVHVVSGERSLDLTVPEGATTGMLAGSGEPGFRVVVSTADVPRDDAPEDRVADQR